MPGFRTNKSRLRKILSEQQNFADWENLRLSLGLSHKEMAAALFALLPTGGILAANAAVGMGTALAGVYREDGAEEAKNTVRRFIWHMNEESGNAGWGIPAAFAQTLIACPPLGKTYHKIFLTYLLDLPGDSNYCDFAPLRSECYDAAESLLDACPEYRDYARPILEKAAEDPDDVCRAKALALREKFRTRS